MLDVSELPNCSRDIRAEAATWLCALNSKHGMQVVYKPLLLICHA